MYEFFNLNESPAELIPMYGTVHMISLLVTVLLIAALFVFQDQVKKLSNNRRLMHWIAWAFLAEQTFYWIMIWAYRYDPISERFPLHLCATLSILMPILILTDSFKWLRFFGYWSIAAGFISMVNPSYGGVEVWSYSFISYHIRHFFLLLMPIVVQIGQGYNHEYKAFIKAVALLAGYGGLIFLIDWATKANYMHLGPTNTLAVPFLPQRFTVWPWTYPSFSVVGFMLLHLFYMSFKVIERRTVSRTV